MSQNSEGNLSSSPSDWIAHAESDLRLARLGAGDSSVLREQVCFHAQQAAEKALKAVLVSREIEFPHSHDIKALLKIVEMSGLVVPPAVQEAASLTPYAVEACYPGFQTEISEKEMEDALRIAEETVSWAKQAASKAGGEDT